jgi:DHA1 family bicyclomycin/chloramphenicol resistance-like MFS transporter
MSQPSKTNWTFAYFIGPFIVFDPIVLDLLVPALPLIADTLQTTPAQLHVLIAFYMIGLALAQLWSGEFVDRFGRKTGAVVGSLLFLISTIIAAAFPVLWALAAARFITGMAAGLCLTAGLAAMRDVYGKDSGHVFGAIYGVTNIIGIGTPLLAGFLASHYGWSANFWAIAVWGVVLSAIALFAFKETAHPKAERFNLKNWLNEYKILLTSKEYMAWNFITGCAYASYLIFISASAYVYSDGYGLSIQDYSFQYSLMIAAFVLGSFRAQTLRAGKKLDEILFLNIFAFCLCGAIEIVNAIWWQKFFVLSMSLCAMSWGTAFVIPHGTAKALAPHPEIAGKAAAGINIVQVLLAAGGGLLATHFYDAKGGSIGFFIFVLGLLAMCLYFSALKQSLKSK